jgi:hypothetical protein
VIQGPWPFDLADRDKGCSITPEEIERVTGTKRTDARRYQLALLRAGELLEKQWRRVKDETITVRIRGDGLIVCTDDDASATNEQRASNGLSMMHRSLRRQLGVDRARLTSDVSRSAHERSLIRIGAYVSGARTTARAALKAHTRQTPGLMKGDK